MKSETTDWTGITALGVSCWGGYLEGARLLLEAGANINHQGEGEGRTALHIAVTINSEDVVRILLEYQPDLEIKSKEGNTPLNSINRLTPLKIVKMLVNRGSDLETKNEAGYSPICTAVNVNNVEAVKYFIAKKANVNFSPAKPGEKQQSPLHVACSLFNLELMKLLVASGANLNSPDPRHGYYTPLQTVFVTLYPSTGDNLADKQISDACTGAAIYLINEAGVDVTDLDGDFLPLNTACGWSSTEIVQLLLDKGAQLDIPDGIGRLPIHHAALQSLESFSLILSAGADVEVTDKMGRTVLHWAVIGGRIEVIERVLSLSKDLLHQADVDGWTPLLWATRGCGTSQRPLTHRTREVVIKTLLDRGADPCIRGEGLERKWSPIQIARYHNLADEIIQSLIAKSKAMETAERLVENEEDAKNFESDTLEKTEKSRPLFYHP